MQIAEKNIRTSFITGCDMLSVFKFAEHVPNLMALFVENFVGFDLQPPVHLLENTGLNAIISQGKSEPFYIIPTICQKVFSRWLGIHNPPCSFIITHLTF